MSPLRNFLRWLYRNRTISLTPEGTRFVFLALAIGLAAVNTGNNLLYLLLAMMLSLIVLSGMLSEQCFKRLKVTRRIPGHVFAGNPTNAYFSIANQKNRLPSFSLHVLDIVDDKPTDRGIYVLNLAPGASTLQSYPLLIPRRGLYRIEAAKLLTRFPFSLFVKGLTIPVHSETVVYPSIKPLPSLAFTELESMGHEHPIARRGRGGELYNLRLYQTGDDSRSIHWKTTARTNLLFVRETEAEDQRRIMLALPTVVPQSLAKGTTLSTEMLQAFEEAVELAASVATHLYERGFSVRAAIGEEWVPEGVGEEHYYQILRALGLCQARSTAEAPTGRHHFGRMLSEHADGGFTVLILPWDDPQIERSCAGSHRVLRVEELREATR